MPGLLTILRSFKAKLALLALAFLAVPALLLGVLSEAEVERDRLLTEAVSAQGRLLARALAPRLADFDGRSALALGEALNDLVEGPVQVKVLLRTGDGLFYMAAIPPADPDYLARERAELEAAGILRRIDPSCLGEDANAVRYLNPAGQAEIITSVTPVLTPAGCWIVLTASTLAALTGSSIGQPYWTTREARAALAIHLSLAALVFILFFGLWRQVEGFAVLARRVAAGAKARFSAGNRVPELGPAAEAFDGMVDRLTEGAALLRDAAEEKTHAFKAPIGVIRNALELLRPANDGHKALSLLERAADRLEGLVADARDLDRAGAALLDPTREPVDVKALLSGRHEGAALDLPEGLLVSARPDLLSPILDNLVENAESFAPGGVTVTGEAARGRVRVTVSDRGPGVKPELLERIFERGYSSRGSGRNFGLGLWLARRYAAALGGTVVAANRPEGGLAVTLDLPAAPG